ncbi:MAG TPA: FtsX-like permease family protein [Xanthobacteraceae bacterium]
MTAVAARFAWREVRGGLRGFGVFIACIALGVLAIAGVGSLSAALSDGLAQSGALLLGGDVAFTLPLREADGAERAFLVAHGTASEIAVLPTMVRTSDGKSALIEAKAVDDAYPLVGSVKTNPDMPLAALFARNGDAFGAAADPSLLARLQLNVGDRISVGSATVEIRAALLGEPDKLGGGIGFGPRVLLSREALRASGLIQPGSLIRWRYRLRLPAGEADDRAVSEIEKQALADFPNAGWDIRTRKNVSPQLERNVERFSQFLALIGFAVLLVGGVGVANAVAAHLARKRQAIATMKALGASGGTVVAVYSWQIMLIALFAACIGAALGAALPFVTVWLFGALLPFPVAPVVHLDVLALSVAYGLLIAFAFALWPLGRAHDTPVSTLFRGAVGLEPSWPRSHYLIAAAVAVAAVAALAICFGYDRRVTAIFAVSAAGLFAILRLVAAAIMAGARRAPRLRSMRLRLAVANIHRPGAVTASIVLSLGIGFSLLVTVVEIEGNLHRALTAALPEHAPSFFFVDIPSADAPRFDALIHQQEPNAALERAPMLRGRIVEARGVSAEDLKPGENSAWVLRGDRGITYAAAVPNGSRLAAGEWWAPDYSGSPLVSLEEKTAKDLGLKIGDDITVNVLGRNVTARIANLRTVDWENLGINFVLVFSPGTFAGAPHTDIATLTFADGGSPPEDAAIITAVAEAFPSVSAVSVKDALDTADRIVGNLAAGLRGASLLTLVAAALVLGGALAASHRSRLYDAVVLRTLGATRRQLLAAYGTEFLIIGLVSVLFGIAAGSLTAGLVVSKLFDFPFLFLAGRAALAAGATLVVVVALGLFGTVQVLGRKPMEVLRNL